jgi:hypothetical protein
MSAIVFVEPPVPPALDVFEAVRAVKLTASERKAVQAARDKLNTAAAIAGTHQDSGTASMAGKEWGFQQRIWDACGEFMANPSPEAADKVGLMVAMSQCAKTTSIELASAVHQIHTKLSAELLPIANRVIDSALEVIEPQIQAARKALESAPGLQAEVRSFDARCARLHQIIADERAVAERDALAWLGINCEV